MKIIVLGGSGVTGQLVRHYLADTNWQVDYCSRSESNDPNHRRLDLLGPRSKVMDALGEYDWAVSCIGPFEKWLAKVARLCVDAGTNYIDINDSIDARQAILSVPAKESGVVVVTGAGLCPGISTALLMSQSEKPVEKIQAVLRIGSGQPAGAASVQSMFETMHGGYRILEAGEIQQKEHPDQVGDLVGYECPDVSSVSAIFPTVRDYSYQVEFSALNAKTIHYLQSKRIFTLPGISRWLAKKASKGVTSKALEAGDPKPANLEITMQTSDEQIIASVKGLTSYQFTALSAATCLQKLAAGDLAPGTYEIAQLPETCELLLQSCKNHGADVSIVSHSL